MLILEDLYCMFSLTDEASEITFKAVIFSEKPATQKPAFLPADDPGLFCFSHSLCHVYSP